VGAHPLQLAGRDGNIAMRAIAESINLQPDTPSSLDCCPRSPKIHLFGIFAFADSETNRHP
jgi:hypothetical protein